jgi:TPR repeat protein
LCTAGFAYCYQEGIGKKRSEASAKKRYSQVEKELAAHAVEDDMYSAYFLSQYYGAVLYNWSEKDKWLEKAAQLGYPKAQCSMANDIANQLLSKKDDKTFDKDKKISEMIEWLNKAVSQNDARGFEGLAYEYYWGKNIPQNKAKAKELYEKSAELGCELAMIVLRKHARIQADAYVF